MSLGVNWKVVYIYPVEESVSGTMGTILACQIEAVQGNEDRYRSEFISHRWAHMVSHLPDRSHDKERRKPSVQICGGNL